MRWRHLPLYGGRLRRGGMRWEIFCHDGGIDLGDGAVRQSDPCLVPAEQRNADIAAQGQGLPIRAQGHHGAVDLAVAGIEHVAVLIFRPLRFMSRTKEIPSQGAFLRSSYTPNRSAGLYCPAWGKVSP